MDHETSADAEDGISPLGTEEPLGAVAGAAERIMVAKARS